MSAIKSAFVVDAPSRQTVEGTIHDALTFLRVVGKDSTIHELLAVGGYSDADTERGFALLREVVMQPKRVVAENPVASATAEIDAWRTMGFAIAQSALTNLHPEQAAFVFEGLDLVDAAAFVLTASVFLERCGQLESGKDRKATHKADLAALATLEARGLTKAERKRLAAALMTVQTQAAPLPEGAATSDDGAARFLALRAWLIDWRNVAKITVKRRDLLLKLGIGKRRSQKAATAPADPVAPAPVATPVAPAPVATPVVPAPVAAPVFPAPVAPAPVATPVAPAPVATPVAPAPVIASPVVTPAAPAPVLAVRIAKAAPPGEESGPESRAA